MEHTGAVVRVQGQRPVRSADRGRPQHGRRLRSVHERLQRGVHPIERQRQDLVGAGERLRQRQLERKAGPRVERRRPRCLHQLHGPQGGDPWIAQSHDGGRTWTQTRITKSDLYYYTFGGDVTPSGRVVFSESAVDYANSIGLTGTTKVFAVVSADHGETWKR